MLRRLLLALASALLLILAWPPRMLAPLTLVAFIPLLWVVRDIDFDTEFKGKKGWAVFGYSFVVFLIWNVACSWWIYYAAAIGAVASSLFNATAMALMMVLYHKGRKNLGPQRALISLPAYWIAFEHFILRWDLSWPWMNLGNAFAGAPDAVQWYEYTGTLGGTLWIWVVNIALYAWLAKFQRQHQTVRQWLRLALRLVLFILVPLALSLQIGAQYVALGDTADVVVIQPNVDPYTEKFNTDDIEQTRRILAIADSVMDDKVDVVLAPETALPGGLNEDRLDREPTIRLIQSWLRQYPNTQFVIGASTYKVYDRPQDASPTARYNERAQYYWDSFNTAISITSDTIQTYHKSKLVVGVEQMPFRSTLQPLLGEAILDLGGTTGTLGMQETRDVFPHGTKDLKVAPVICWESVFGEFVTDYANNGADFLGIITNDGWWRDTDGYKQHFAYAKLRAIENRRSVARAANTGISGFIDFKGNTLQRLGWDKRGALRQEVFLSNAPTLYQRYGDAIGRLAYALAIAFLLYVFVRGRVRA